MDEWLDEDRRDLTAAFEGESDARGPIDGERWWSRLASRGREMSMGPNRPE